MVAGSRNPEHVRDPDRFDPDRFNPDRFRLARDRDQHLASVAASTSTRRTVATASTRRSRCPDDGRQSSDHRRHRAL
jgi:hypothetical protein